MTGRREWLIGTMAAAMVLIAVSRSSSQTRYDRGQTIAPVFEGWEPNADGTFNLVFGAMNRNYEEEVDIPIGPNNMFESGGADQGQPTHFYPRRQQFVFKVKVPKDWGQKELAWTLTFRGHTEKAFGVLLPTWELGNLVYQENRGGPGDLGDIDEPNEPPSIKLVGPPQRAVAVSESLTLTTEVSDDGHPTPRASGPGGAQTNGPLRESPVTQAIVRLDPGVRLGVTWVLYRGGPGTVTFTPMRIRVVDGKAVTNVRFSQPGTYGLRAYADDGVLLTPVDVTVTVK